MVMTNACTYEYQNSIQKQNSTGTRMYSPIFVTMVRNWIELDSDARVPSRHGSFFSKNHSKVGENNVGENRTSEKVFLFFSRVDFSFQKKSECTLHRHLSVKLY
jgi:hypothetical protein